MFSIGLLWFVLSLAAPDGSPNTGWAEHADDNDLAKASVFLIMPDGSGLPAGQGSVAEGETLFETHCLACHGERGSGGTGGALTGGSLAGSAPTKTVGSYWPYAPKVFDYIRRAMPYGNPASLSDSAYYALTAYVLNVNGLVSDDAVMNSTTLPSVVMPNHDGFISAYPKRPKGTDPE